MPLNREESRRAEGYGYYATYGADAQDVLDYIESDINGLTAKKDLYYDRHFKVTIIVEEA